MPDYRELSFKTSMLSLHNRTIGRHILRQIGDHIAGHADRRRRPRRAGCKLRKDARRVIDEVRIIAGLFDLLRRHAARELVDDRSDHLEMTKFF